MIKTASSAKKAVKAVKSRAAMDCAKAVSVARTAATREGRSGREEAAWAGAARASRMERRVIGGSRMVAAVCPEAGLVGKCEMGMELGWGGAQGGSLQEKCGKMGQIPLDEK